MVRKNKQVRIQSHLKTTWFNMPSHGGRCDEWSNYEVFKKWALENGYTIFSGIRRKDCTKPFCPDNIYFDNKLEIQILDIRKRQQKLKKFVEDSVRNNFSFVKEVVCDSELYLLYIEGYVEDGESQWISDKIRVCDVTKEQKEILLSYLGKVI